MPRAKRQREERNRLLNALPPDEYERVRAQLTETTLELHKCLEEPGTTASYVYFPWSGVCSLTATMRDGRMVEVGTIGNEGVVGMSGYFGGQLPDVMTVVQVPGSGAHVMRRGVFLAEMDRAGALYHLVRRYSQALLALMTQSVACNALHDIDQRCARWLLMTHDRVDGDVLELTQEYLATMLGVRRPSVTDVARRLQRAKLIDYRRGRIRILDRGGLEAQSCECYATVRRHFERLVP
jgi:CRP-like cAMP-binding protein